MTRLALPAAAVLLAAVAAVGEPVHDPSYDPADNPALALPASATWPAGTGPRVRVDATHENALRIGGSYRGFAELLRADGYRVEELRDAFAPDCVADIPPLAPGARLRDGAEPRCAWGRALRETDVLVLPPPRRPLSPAAVVRLVLWIASGGRLLVVVDPDTVEHAALLLAFLDVADWRKGADPPPPLPYVFAFPNEPTPRFFEWNRGLRTEFLFHRENGSLAAEHPVAAAPGAEVGYVAGGRSAGFRRLSAEETIFGGYVRDYTSVLRDPAGGEPARGIALRFWRGRVFVVGDPSLFAAWIDTDGDTEKDALCAGAPGVRAPLDPASLDCHRLYVAKECEWSRMFRGCASHFDAFVARGSPGARGMHVTRDNERFLLNVVHWLDGTLGP